MIAERSLTPNQKTVLNVLADARHPLSAYDILASELARADGVKAPATVYRALEKLTALGLVHRIECLNAFVCCRHGPHQTPAAFIICEACRTIVELKAEDVIETVTRRASDRDFEVERVSLEIAGRCAACRSH